MFLFIPKQLSTVFSLKKSYLPEILDGRDYSREELFRNLRELYLVNRWLGGHAGSSRLLRACLGTGFLPEKVLDIGCGGGDTLEMLEKIHSGDLPGVSWTGCDLHPGCLEYARRFHPGKRIEYLLSDFREVQLSEKVLCHAALFFHHFREEEIIGFIRHLQEKGAALIINDLQRHPLAWLSIRIISALPFFGRLFRNDAPLSVKRGFSLDEWKEILRKSGVQNYRIRRAWAFRHHIFIPPTGHAAV